MVAALLLSACNPQAKKTGTTDSTQAGPAKTNPAKPSTAQTPASPKTPGTPRHEPAKESRDVQQEPASEEPKKISAEDRQRATRLVEKARDQLNDGHNDAAKESITNALMLDPENETARSYSRQLDGDPASILNEATGDAAAAKTCEYTVVPGDTLSKIAERAYTVELRTTLFVSLARLNEINPPKSVQPRQTIKVPALDCDKLQPKKLSPAQKTQTKPPPAPKPAPPSPEIRGSATYQDGVKALNSGNKAKAFTLFKKATDADPSDARAQASYSKLLQERDDWYRQCAASRTARDYKNAVENCKKVLAIDPNHEMAGRHMREAQRYLPAN